MPEVIIADTSCFILLSKIGHLNLLQKLYGTVVTTDIIVKEFGAILPNWIIVKKPEDFKYQNLLELYVDRGEASAITLALEELNSVIILDDLKARKLAKQLNLKVTGTLGVIIKAKQLGVIISIKPFIIEIRRTNFRISATLENLILKEAGEHL